MNGLLCAIKRLRNANDGGPAISISIAVFICSSERRGILIRWQNKIFYFTVSQVKKMFYMYPWRARAKVAKQYKQRHWRSVPMVIDKNYTPIYADVLTF